MLVWHTLVVLNLYPVELQAIITESLR